MADNIIDLTRSPDPPPSRPLRSPRIIRSRAPSTRARSRRTPRALCPNRNEWYINQLVAACICRQLFPPNCEIYQIFETYGVEVSVHGDQVQLAAVNNVPMSATSLNPHGTNLNEDQNIPQAKTLPLQVQSNADGFFEHQPSTYSYYATTTVVDLISRNENHMARSSFFSDPMMPYEPQPTLPLFPVPPTEEGNDNTYGFQMQASADSTSMNVSDEGDFPYEPQPTLPLFPEQALFFPVPPEEEGNDNTYGFQMQASLDSTLMNARDEGGLDLELNLGRGY